MGRVHRLDDDTRTKLIVALQAGRQPADLARQFSIHIRTVQRLRKEHIADYVPPDMTAAAAELTPSVATTEPSANRDNAAPPLMHIFAAQGVEGMIEIFKLAKDPTYIRKFPPSQNALLLNAIGNSVARVIEATAGAPGSEAEALEARRSAHDASSARTGD